MRCLAISEVSIYLSLSLSISLSLSLSLSIHVYIYIYIYVYRHIDISRGDCRKPPGRGEAGWLGSGRLGERRGHKEIIISMYKGSIQYNHTDILYYIRKSFTRLGILCCIRKSINSTRESYKRPRARAERPGWAPAGGGADRGPGQRPARTGRTAWREGTEASAGATLPGGAEPLRRPRRARALPPEAGSEGISLYKGFPITRDFPA